MGIDTELSWYGDFKIKDMNAGMIRFLIRGTNLIQASAKRNLTENKNIDTGNLRGSIVKTVFEDKLLGTVSTNVEYSKFIEFGTGRFAEGGGGRQTPWAFQLRDGSWRWTTGFKASPFMRPALKDNIDKLEKIAISEGVKAIDK